MTAHLRYWFEQVLVATFYGSILYFAYATYTAPPRNLAGAPCGGSIRNHWQWGGTPEHIVPVCLPVDAQSAKR